MVRGGALGDFVLTLPVLAALRRQFPAIHLEVLAYPQYAGLAVAAGLADAVQSIESRSLAGFFARNGVLDPGLAEYFSSFHIILSYLYDPDELFRSNLMKVSEAQVIQGPHRPDDSADQHAAHQLLAPLQRLAIFDADSQPRIASPFLGAHPRFLAAHPGSGSDRKNWPEGSWASLLSRWTAYPDRKVLLIGGEAEGDRLGRLESRLPADRVQTARSLPLNTVVELLKTCTGFIGHDSGISHLAAACGLPGLVLWGPSPAVVWRPLSPVFECMPSPAGLAELPADSVFCRLNELWHCWTHGFSADAVVRAGGACGLGLGDSQPE